MARLGIFGGTFNPVHYGHLRAAEEAREKMALDKVLFVPSGTPPLKSADLAAALHRLQMTRLATGSNPFFEVLPTECEQEGPSYTVDTMEKLRRAYPLDSLYFIMGVDSFAEIGSWHMPQRLLGMADFIVVSRPGSLLEGFFSSPFIEGPEDHETRKRLVLELAHGRLDRLALRLRSGREVHLLPITELAISATAIRGIFRRGGSARYLLPENVESYIISNGLYRQPLTAGQ